MVAQSTLATRQYLLGEKEEAWFGADPDGVERARTRPPTQALIGSNGAGGNSELPEADVRAMGYAPENRTVAGLQPPGKRLVKANAKHAEKVEQTALRTEVLALSNTIHQIQGAPEERQQEQINQQLALQAGVIIPRPVDALNERVQERLAATEQRTVEAWDAT